MDEDEILVTTDSGVYLESFDEIHDDLVKLDNDLTETNNFLEHLVFGMDILIIILIVFLISNCVFKFFSRGFKDV